MAKHPLRDLLWCNSLFQPVSPFQARWPTIARSVTSKCRARRDCQALNSQNAYNLGLLEIPSVQPLCFDQLHAEIFEQTLVHVLQVAGPVEHAQFLFPSLKLAI